LQRRYDGVPDLLVHAPDKIGRVRGSRVPRPRESCELSLVVKLAFEDDSARGAAGACRGSARIHDGEGLIGEIFLRTHLEKPRAVRSTWDRFARPHPCRSTVTSPSEVRDVKSASISDSSC